MHPPREHRAPFNDGAEVNTTPARFGVPELADLPDDIRETIEDARSKLGFIPNVFLAYAQRPEHFRAFMHYHDLLMKGPSGLSRAEREAIIVVVSAANDCLYCIVAHGAALSEHDVWDVAAIAAFFGFSNRMAGALDMRPNPQFYAMGRS